MLNLVVLISGSGSNLQSIIDHIDAGKLDARISAVISDREDAYGLERAQKSGISCMLIPPEIYASKFDYEDVLAQTIAKCVPDIIVLAGFMRILSGEFVQQFQGQIINIHPSLLPQYKGLNTHQRAIDAGDKIHGATVHFVTAELDDGPVIIQRHVEITDQETPESLQKRVLQEEHKIYPQAIQLIAQGKVCFEQPSFDRVISGQV